MIAIQSILLNENKTWQFTWTDTGAEYYRIVLNGMEIDQTTDPEYTFELPGYATYPPPLEIVEELELASSEINLPFLTIQWYDLNNDDVTSYEVREWISGQWVKRYSVNNSNSWIYTVQTPILDDQTEHLYEVIALGDIQQESNSVEFRIVVVRPPTLKEDEIEVDYDDDAEEIIIQEVN